jgi:hypothetical protein
MAIAGQIRQFELRKWAWLAGGVVFGLMLVLMVPAGYALQGAMAGAAIVVLLGIGSLARGVSSIAFKDVLAKTIPRGRRGRLLALRASAGGGLALLVGIFLRTQLAESTEFSPYLVLIGLGGGLWILGASLASFIVEEPGATAGARDALREARYGIRLLLEVPGYRRYVLARGILLTVELSLPYYVLLSKQITEGRVGELGLFVIAASSAQVISSPLWGRFSDRSSRLVMMWAGLTAGSAGLLAVLLKGQAGSGVNPLLAAAPLFIIGISQAGVRLGRKTYIVDGAPKLERPTYVAVSNSVIGLLTILGAGLGFMADVLGVQSLILTLIGLALLGAGLAWGLPEAEDMIPSNPP